MQVFFDVNLPLRTGHLRCRTCHPWPNARLVRRRWWIRVRIRHRIAFREAESFWRSGFLGDQVSIKADGAGDESSPGTDRASSACAVRFSCVVLGPAPVGRRCGALERKG